MRKYPVEILYKSALQWIESMLLSDEISLKDVPQEIRVSTRNIYINAFRISRNISCKRYIRDLKILCKDIYMMDSDEPQRKELVDLLNTYLTLNDFTEEDEFIDFQKNIYPEVLCELHKHTASTQRSLQEQFRKYGTV